MEKENSFSHLDARLADLAQVAVRGDLGMTSFLSPRELHYATAVLTKKGVRFCCFGGFCGAERQKIYLLPDYMEDMDEASLSSILGDYGFDCGIASLRIQGSGFCRLTHRDYLGSLLGLGIERSVLGDIVVKNGTDSEKREAWLLCESEIVRFLLAECKKVGNDKVKVEELPLPEGFSAEKKVAPISDTVASSRLDCIVAALCSYSREKAREVIVSGLVELDFESEERPDHTVETPCMLSVRGVGRFHVLSASDQTKKGRYRLLAEKYL